MPIVLNRQPGATIGPPIIVLDATSPDGTLRAKFDPDSYGVWLIVSFPKMSFVVEPLTVTIFRGDGEKVRGAESLPVLGDAVKKAYAFDHEIPIGGVSTWYIEITTATGMVFQHQKVSLRLPELSGGPEEPSTWLKSLEHPSLSANLMINKWPDVEYEIFTDTIRPLNQRFPVTTNELDEYENNKGIGGFSGSVAFVLQNQKDLDKVLGIVTNGTFFLSVSPQFNKPTMYATATNKLKITDFATMRNEQKICTLELKQVTKPAVTKQAMRVPSHTLADRMRDYPTLGSKLIHNLGYTVEHL